MENSRIAERFLLLHNNACCGIVRQTDESNLLMVMSPSGQHVHIYHAGSHYKHLTRFVPIRFEEAVGRMILFRNTYSLAPYFCSRYNSISYHSIHDVDDLFPIITCDSPKNIRLYLCPLLERIYCIQQYFVKNDDTCIEHELKTTASNGIMVSEVVNVYPIRNLPENIQLLIINIAQNRQMNETNEIYVNSTESAVQAIELLDTVMTYMSVLSSHNNHNRYLNTLPCNITTENNNDNNNDNVSKYSTLAMAEVVDGDVFIVSKLPNTTQTNREKSIELKYNTAIHNLKEQHIQRTQCYIEETEEIKDINTEQLEVEVWLQHTNTSSINSSGSSSSSSSKTNATCSTAATTSIPTSKDDIIIRLYGDYFTFIYPVVVHNTTTDNTSNTTNTNSSSNTQNTEKNTIIKRKKLHISFIQYELQQQARFYDINTETNEIIWTEHHEELYKNNNTTSTGISINTTTNTTTNTENEINVYTLLRKYYKQVVRLIYYREHILEKQGQGFDPSIRKKTIQHVSSSSSSSSSSSRCYNTTTGTTTSPSTSSTNTNTTSSSGNNNNDINTIRKTYPDGSTYTALLRTCHSRQEADTYQLSLLLIPNHLNTTTDTTAHTTTSTTTAHTTTSTTNGIYNKNELTLPCQCVAQINAVFPDRTLLKFQVSTQIFHIIFATGEECQFSLGSYKRQDGIFAPHPYIPTINNAFSTETTSKSMKNELNINKIIQYIQSILAFYRWANTPEELRPQLEEHDRRNALLARSSALKTHRYLVSNEISKGNLTLAEASAKTKAFLARLDGISPKDGENDSNISYNYHQCIHGASAYSTPIRPTTTTTTASTGRNNPFYPLPVDPTAVACSTVRTIRQGSTIGCSSTTSTTGRNSGSAGAAVYGSSAGKGYSSSSSSGRDVPYTATAAVTPDSAAAIVVENYNSPTTTFTAMKMNVITPEHMLPKDANKYTTKTTAADIIHSAADYRAGAYIHSNVSILLHYSSFGRTTTPSTTTIPRSAVVTPPSNSSNSTNNNNYNPPPSLSNIHTIHIPHTRQDFPQYALPVDRSTTKYLSATYIKDVLNSSTKLLASHREYLSNVHTTTVL